MPKGKPLIDVDATLNDHKMLRARVADLSSYLERPRPPIGEKGYHTWASDLTGRLVKLHDLLFRHFREEERSRLFEELAEQHPNHADTLEGLKADHGTLLNTLRELTAASMTYSEGKDPGDGRLRRRVSEFLETAGSHERRETRLIQKLHLRDIGRGS